jgi:hypothetical protein
MPRAAAVALLCQLIPASAAFGWQPATLPTAPRLLHPTGGHGGHHYRVSLPPRCVSARFNNRMNRGPMKDLLELDDPDTQSRPEELLGPWELKCSLSGFGDMWVELHEDGSCSCSRSVGSGVSWYAERIKGRWRLRITLNDKLKRPLTFQGAVNDDDDRGTGISGSVLGPPKLRGASDAEVRDGVVMGEFAGYHNA